MNVKTENGESRLKRPRGRPPKVSREHSSFYDNPKKNKHGEAMFEYSLHCIFHYLKHLCTWTLLSCYMYFASLLHLYQPQVHLFHTDAHASTHLPYCAPLFAAPRGTHLWEFIRDILIHPEKNQGLMKWEDRREGVFKFLKSEAVAQMWGQKKKNSSMTYEKLSRAMR